MGRKYAVLGVGHVGATVAFALVTKGDADELVLIDKDEKKARAEQLDLEDATARLETRPKIKIQDYSELADTDILFVTAGNILALKHQTGNNRWAEFNDTRQIVKDIAPKIKASGFHGVLIDTMNPCDAITQYLQKEIGLPQSQVMATGTFLDTARMQRVVAEQFDVDPKNVSGFVYGEHGNSQFIAWSTVKVNGLDLLPLAKKRNLPLKELEEHVKAGGWDVYAGKGYTSYAIATCAVKLSRAVLDDAHLMCPCSFYNQKYNSYVGQPAIIGKNGVEEVVDIPLTPEEEAKLANSAKTIKEKFATL
jgi:L-lactate dehydrogenase